MYQSCSTNREYDSKFNQFFPNNRRKVYDRFKILMNVEIQKRYVSECTPCIFINYMLCSSRDERFIMYQLWIDQKDKISLIWWRHLEYYWLIKYVSIVYSVRLLVEPKDVVLILVSHSDSCFTIRLVDLWALYIFLFPYIQRVTYIAAIHQICAFCVRLCNVAI